MINKQLSIQNLCYGKVFALMWQIGIEGIEWDMDSAEIIVRSQNELNIVNACIREVKKMKVSEYEELWADVHSNSAHETTEQYYRNNEEEREELHTIFNF